MLSTQGTPGFHIDFPANHCGFPDRINQFPHGHELRFAIRLPSLFLGFVPADGKPASTRLENGD
jgi:hypothetical protein